MIAAFLKKLIRFYQIAISPSLTKSCRYQPTCSAYAIQAIDKHGTLKGLYLAITRTTRCTPWSKNSHYDPVPESFQWFKKDSSSN